MTIAFKLILIKLFSHNKDSMGLNNILFIYGFYVCWVVYITFRQRLPGECLDGHFIHTKKYAFWFHFVVCCYESIAVYSIHSFRIPSPAPGQSGVIEITLGIPFANTAEL